MSLRIRLQRVGKKNRPMFRICVIERTKAPKGSPIEIIGIYDPIKKKIQIDLEKYQKWLKNGATPSDTVKSLIKRVQKDQEFKKEIISAISSNEINKKIL
ncbi:MAG: 30S ribosomal protein S16 [Endomicrobia bacterium]|nr:30S ribosomal protein S16 [Endomicrobiia bacterium]